MIGSGQFRLDSQEFVKLFHQSGGEVGSTIRNNVVRKTVKFPDVVAEKSGKTKGRGFIGARNEVGFFSKSIGDYQDCVTSLTLRKGNDHVRRDRFPRGVRNGKKEEFSNRFLRKRFCAIASVAAFDVFDGKSRKTWPPIVASDQFYGFPLSGMTCGKGIVMQFYDLAS